MKKWYQSTVLRTILIMLTIAATTLGFVSLTIIANCMGDFSVQDMLSDEEKVFEETDGFESLIHQSVNHVLWQESTKVNLETDGEYDPEKLVDIMTFSKNRKITGKNESGLAYTLKDLISWGDVTEIDIGSYRNNNIIVCQRPDGSYYYYYTGEFQTLLEEGELRLVLDENYSSTEFMEELMNGYYNEAGQFSGNILIKNKESETLYTDCWAFTESLDELVAPDGAKNILEIVNQTESFNGKLTEIYNNLEIAINEIRTLSQDYESNLNGTFEEGNTNFTYYLLNVKEGNIYTNHSSYEKQKDAKKVIEAVKKQENLAYVIVQPKLKDFDSNMKNASASTWKSVVESEVIVSSDYVFVAAVDKTYPIQDIFYESAKEFNKFAPYYESAMKLLFVSIILLSICLVWLTVIAGRSENQEGLKIYRFDHWKTEIAAVVIIGGWVLLTAIFGELIYMSGGTLFYDSSGYIYYEGYFLSMADVILTGIYGFLTAIFFLSGYLSLVRRIKARTLWKDSLCKVCVTFAGKYWKMIREFWRQRNIIWKTLLIIGGVLFIHWMAFSGSGVAVMLALIVEIAVVSYLLWEAIIKDRIRKGIKRISEGDVTHEISTDKMIGVNKEIAENLNHIGDGLQNAVNEMMKSERLKTDLITNVSHDIKTPLTSIINYVDLLKRENIEDPKIQGYIQILEEKAQRLKTLTEDVVEASKVSSGNISLEYMDVDLVEMLNQTIGEFSEKFEARALKIKVNVPEEPVVIHVDNHRMWRVLENIFNNAAKYSMPGTRVYADLRKENKKVKFSLKNISEQPLNINADELTERFIRGDISRSTEGSGLGLSIAKNLTQLQGGTFELYLDGDLFKVNIEFPVK